MRKTLLMGLGVAAMILLVSTATAADRVTRSHTIDMDGIGEVEVSNGVGRLDIIPAEGGELRVVVVIEGKRHGLFRRQVDVENMDIEVSQRGDTPFLSFEEDNTSAEWLVEMPRVDRTTLRMGVGEVRIEAGATELDVELGVGDVRIEAPEASVGRIDLSVGVGNADLRGGELIDRDAAFISQSIRARGKGTHDLDVEVGVGDINVRLD